MMTSWVDARRHRRSPEQAAAPHSGRLLGVLIAIVFLTALLSSLGTPFIPAVADAYGVSLGAAQWMLTVPQLCAAVITPIICRVGDGARRREVLLASLLVIALGTVLAALPGPFILLLVGRAMHGVGLALLPLSMAVARDHLAPDKVPSALGILAVTAPAGLGLGYPVSGLLADVLGFRLTFAVAAVVAAGVLIASWRTLPDTCGQPRQPVDVRGATLMGLGLVLLVGGLSQSAAWGASSPLFLGSLVGGAALLGVWACREWNSSTPLVNLRTMTVRGVRVAHHASLLTGAGVFLLMSLVVRYVQTPTWTGYGQDRSVMVAGLLLVPFSVMSLVANRALPLLRRVVGDGWLIPLGCLGFIAGMTLFLLARTDIWWLAIATGAAGLGVGLVFAATTVLVVRCVEAAETASTLGFNMVLRCVGGALGSGLITAVLAAHTDAGERFPVEAGYDRAALVAIALWAVVAVVTWPRRDLWTPSAGLDRRSAGSSDDAIMGSSERIRAEPSG